MSSSTHNDFDRNNGAGDAEKTLRLIATLPAPEGIEERVKARLHATPLRADVIRWPNAGYRDGWMHFAAIRAAAAAAIVVAVVGGGWEVYSHIQVAPSPAAVATPQPISRQSGLSTAGARRAPQTLEGPVVVKQNADAVNAGTLRSTPGKHVRTTKARSSVPPQR